MIFGYAVLDRTNRPFTAASGVALFPTTMRAAADRLLADTRSAKFDSRLVALVERPAGSVDQVAGLVVVDSGGTPLRFRGYADRVLFRSRDRDMVAVHLTVARRDIDPGAKLIELSYAPLPKKG